MGEQVIVLTDLTKKYGNFTAVDHISLSICKGEIFGLLGPNGAGKSTTILMMLGLTEPTSGKVEICGIDSTTNKKTGKYSRGMRQRLGLADVLIKNPEIIILDEPTSGIDPAGIQEFIELIRNLSRVHSLTVLFSSHNLDQVQKACDRVGLFNHGKLLAQLDLEEMEGKQVELIDVYNDYVKEGGEKHEQS